jgi:mRNA interferase HigB
MKLLGRNKLHALHGIDEQIDKWLVSWVSELSCANWKHSKDVLRQFPYAQCSADGIFLFRIAPYGHCIEVSIMFPLAIVVVTDLKCIK